MVLTEAEQTFVLGGVNEPVIPSLLRDFSAPVTLNYPYSEQELATLLAADENEFARWEAAQTLYHRAINANRQALAERPSFTGTQSIDGCFGFGGFR